MERVFNELCFDFFLGLKKLMRGGLVYLGDSIYCFFFVNLLKERVKIDVVKNIFSFKV